MTLNLSELEHLHADIEAVLEIVQTLKARIDGKEIEIHICKNRSGRYFYELSHDYWGADYKGPYGAAENSFSTVQEAARGALRDATSFYRSTDEGGTWVVNESF